MLNFYDNSCIGCACFIWNMYLFNYSHIILGKNVYLYLCWISIPEALFFKLPWYFWPAVDYSVSRSSILCVSCIQAWPSSFMAKGRFPQSTIQVDHQSRLTIIFYCLSSFLSCTYKLFPTCFFVHCFLFLPFWHSLFTSLGPVNPPSNKAQIFLGQLPSQDSRRFLVLPLSFTGTRSSFFLSLLCSLVRLGIIPFYFQDIHQLACRLFNASFSCPAVF